MSEGDPPPRDDERRHDEDDRGRGRKDDREDDRRRDRSDSRDRPARSPSRERARRERSASPRDRRDRDYGRRRSPSRSRSRSRSRDRYERRRDRSYSPRRRSRSRDRGGPSYGAPPERRVPPRYGLQMFVAGFNFLSTERDVEKRFGRYGKVTEVRIVREPNGKSRGFGFVAMDNEEDVKECIREMNGRDWEGRRLQVELCRNPK